MKDIKFLFIGCGSIGKTLLELWMIKGIHKNNKITIIEPELLPEWILNFNKHTKHIQVGITEKNAKKLHIKINCPISWESIFWIHLII